MGIKMAEEQPELEQEAPIKAIHIEVSSDGTLSVGMMGGEMQPVESIDEALMLARQLLEDDGTTEDEQIMKGYQSGAKTEPQVSPEQVFGGG